jgi:hypothetical protein
MAAHHKKPKLIKTVDLFSRVISKVDDWSVKTEIEQQEFAQFMWSPEDKKILKDLLLNTKNQETKSLFLDLKFKAFVHSVIENGLNTDDMKLYQQFKHRLPLRALGLAYDQDDLSISTTSIRTKQPIRAGFYMLEIQIDIPVFCSKIPINLVASQSVVSQPKPSRELAAELSFPLNVQSGSLAKRLVRLSKDAVLSLELAAESSAQDLAVFRLIKVSKKFFISRIYKKLGKSLTLDQLDASSEQQVEEGWQDYKSVFKTDSNPADNYQDFVAKQEHKAIPSTEHQLASLSKWLVKTGRVSALPKS